MFVKYTYASRGDCFKMGVTDGWIDACEAHNYIFEVVRETDTHYYLRIERNAGGYSKGERVFIKKHRCEEHYSEYSEVTLPKELFEI